MAAFSRDRDNRPRSTRLNEILGQNMLNISGEIDSLISIPKQEMENTIKESLETQTAPEINDRSIRIDNMTVQANDANEFAESLEELATRLRQEGLNE